MIVSRRAWHYNTVCSLKVRKIEFKKPVTKVAVRQYVATQYNKLVYEIWPR